MDKAERLERAQQVEAESVDKFHTAHEEGTAALERHDYPAVAKAISDETAAIETHKDAIDQSRQAFGDLSQNDDSTSEPHDE